MALYTPPVVMAGESSYNLLRIFCTQCFPTLGFIRVKGILVLTGVTPINVLSI